MTPAVEPEWTVGLVVIRRVTYQVIQLALRERRRSHALDHQSASWRTIATAPAIPTPKRSPQPQPRMYA